MGSSNVVVQALVVASAAYATFWGVVSTPVYVVALGVAGLRRARRSRAR